MEEKVKIQIRGLVVIQKCFCYKRPKNFHLNQDVYIRDNFLIPELEDDFLHWYNDGKETPIIEVDQNYILIGDPSAIRALVWMDTDGLIYESHVLALEDKPRFIKPEEDYNKYIRKFGRRQYSYSVNLLS